MTTKTLLHWLVLVAGLFVTQVAVSQAPAGAPAGATGLCKDGTYYTGASKQGACRGHQGVKEWYGAPATSTSTKSDKSTTSDKSTKSEKATSSSSAMSTAATTSSQAPAAAPAGATGLCKDGTYYTGASKQGACRGHQGVKEWYGAPEGAGKSETAATKSEKAAPASSTTSAPPPTSKSASASSAPAPAASQSAPATKSSTSTMAQAPGGGAGQVWLNTASNVYHCPGSRYYGKTKTGAYMTEAEAKAKGAHPDHGEACK
jgi:hypothetical protein